MAVKGLFAGEIATELLKQLFAIVRRSALCKASAEQLTHHIQHLLPIIEEIKYSGVELPQFRQSRLDRVSELLKSGLDLSNKVLASSRRNEYRNLQLAQKMEKLEKQISRFVQGSMQAHVLANVHYWRFDFEERFDRIEGYTKRLERQLSGLRLGGGGGGFGGGGGWLEEEMKRVEELKVGKFEEGGSGVGVEVGVKKIKKMVMRRKGGGCGGSGGGGGGGGVLGICEIGGSGKTTLATELCKDLKSPKWCSTTIPQPTKIKFQDNQPTKNR